jgi:hypothetical protein
MRLNPGLCASVLLAGAVAPTAHAQTGKWVDGELLVLVETTPSTGRTLYRIDPETGDGEPLLTNMGAGGLAGHIVYDSFRSVLLVNRSLPPDDPADIKLWFVDYDGTSTAVPGLKELRALATAGDGRVFFQRNAVAGSPDHIEYLDANDQISKLKDATGVSDLDFEVEHLLYDLPGNALIATTSFGSPNSCSATGASVFRIPLSADGSQVAAGEVIPCIKTGGSSDGIVSLDPLQGGKVLLTLTNGSSPAAKLLGMDPLTLSLSPFADPDEGNLDGGVWCPRIAATVVLDDATNVLRKFSSGGGGQGSILVTDVPVGDAKAGFAPEDKLWDIEVLGPGCEGLALPYGSGLAGNGGIQPCIRVSGCPDIGETFAVLIDGVNGGAIGLLFVGLEGGATPFKGGTFLLGSVDFIVPCIVPGPLGVAGAGNMAIPASLADPLLLGIDLYLQCGYLDAAAVKGVSLTNGLRIQAG